MSGPDSVLAHFRFSIPVFRLLPSALPFRNAPSLVSIIQSMPKLFIPGPVQVSEKTFRAFCQPMIGHRSGDFKKLYERIHPRLQTLFGTKQPVFLSTSSAWGVMEGSIRNLVGTGKVLNC